MALSIATSTNGESRVIRVSGEVDVSNKEELNAAITSAQQAGIGVWVAAAHRAPEAGTRFFVSHPQRNVARVLTMLGMGEELGLVTD